MPENSKTHKIYKALLRKGKSKASAAKIAQKVTGKSLKTGRSPKRSKR